MSQILAMRKSHSCSVAPQTCRCGGGVAYPHGLDSTSSSSRRVEQGSAVATVSAAAVVAVAVAVTISGPFLQLSGVLSMATGAGKTFTMCGSTANYKYRGLIPRAINKIFSEVGGRFDN